MLFTSAFSLESSIRTKLEHTKIAYGDAFRPQKPSISAKKQTSYQNLHALFPLVTPQLPSTL
jgi:hypothetical protein